MTDFLAEKLLDAEARDDKKVVAGWLLHYHERKRRYEQRRQEILNSSPPTIPDSPVRGTTIGDNTGNRGAKLGDMKSAFDWLALVEEVEAGLPPKMRLFLRLRREARYAKTNLRGRPGWVTYVQENYAREMAKANKKRPSDYWVESRTLFAWWDRIVTFATIKASKRGLLKEWTARAPKD